MTDVIRRHGYLAGMAAAAVVLLLVLPLALTPFRLDQFGRYLCIGIIGVGIGLAWGRGGMLVLGQGVFFGIGAYAMAMHLKLADSGGEQPDFMRLYGQRESLPAWWVPFENPGFALLAAVLLPMALAALLGLLIFRQRVRGAYFAILSQALAAAFALLLVGNQGTTGGTNGLTDFDGFFGYSLDDPANKRIVYLLVAVALLAVVAVARQLMVSRYGELLVAVRDAEERVRFLGYDPAVVKLVAYMVAAGMAGIAGALFVPVVGIINPSLVGIVPSIGFVIGVAVGGRAGLAGPPLGAIAVAWAGTTLSETYPAQWNYFQGLLFILVIAFLPGGLAALVPAVRGRLDRRRRTGGTPAGGAPDTAATPPERTPGRRARARTEEVAP